MRQNDFVTLIVGRYIHRNEAAIGMAAGKNDSRDLGLHAQGVAGPHRKLPCDIRLDADNRAGQGRIGGLDKELDAQRAGLPAARNKTAEHAVFGGLFVEMKILGIILAREANDVLRADRDAL